MGFENWFFIEQNNITKWIVKFWFLIYSEYNLYKLYIWDLTMKFEETNWNIKNVFLNDFMNFDINISQNLRYIHRKAQ